MFYDLFVIFCINVVPVIQISDILSALRRCAKILFLSRNFEASDSFSEIGRNNVSCGLNENVEIRVFKL